MAESMFVIPRTSVTGSDAARVPHPGGGVAPSALRICHSRGLSTQLSTDVENPGEI